MSAPNDSGRNDPDTPETSPETTEPMSFPQVEVGVGLGPYSGGLSPHDAATVEALPAGNALLLVQDGPSAGARFLLDADEVSAGRHPDSDIFLDDVTVSRGHAVFSRRADGYHLKDVGSLNGTYLNRERIDEVLLGSRDEVQIGKYRLIYFPAPPRKQTTHG